MENKVKTEINHVFFAKINWFCLLKKYDPYKIESIEIISVPKLYSIGATKYMISCEKSEIIKQIKIDI